MSKLVNEYGAFHGEIVDEIRDQIDPYYRKLKVIADKYGLESYDIILLQHFAQDSLNIRFAEDRIRTAMGKRRLERKSKGDMLSPEQKPAHSK